MGKRSRRRKRTGHDRTEVAVSDRGIRASLPSTQAAEVGEQLRELFSPIIEGAGLIGDYLRFFRQAAAVRAMKRVREIAEQNEVELEPVPPRFLIPWVEAVSLEEPDSPLIDLWAHLLVSASTNANSHHVHFVSVISGLSAKQGRLFTAIVGTDIQYSLEYALDNIKMYFQSHRIRESITDRFAEAEKANDFIDLDKAAQIIAMHMNCLGVDMVYADVGIDDPANFADVSFPYESVYSDEHEVDFSILEAVGLIRRVDVDVEILGRYSVSLIYHHLTQLGLSFAEACGIVRDVRVATAKVTDSDLVARLTDDRTVAVPLDELPQLRAASQSQRANIEIVPLGVYWPELKEVLSVAEMLSASRAR